MLKILPVLNAENEFKIAIIGMGPRGLSVLEHFVYNCMKEHPKRKVRILCIDSHEVGVGRIWRTDQADHFMMNTLTGQVTMYSFGPDGGPPRAGHGPSLFEWLRDNPDENMPTLGPNDYAPRVVYGHYLKSVYKNILDNLPPNVEVESIIGYVVALQRDDEGSHTLTLADDGGTRSVHKVVLTTGHPQHEPTGAKKQFLRFAQQNPGLHFIAGDSAACMPLHEVPSTGRCAIIGQGLGFYDALLSLTVGRGGHFENIEGRLVYIPSGREPKLVSGSRSGSPIFARGMNMKKPGQSYKPLFMNEKALHEARIRSRRERDTEKLDFNRDVFPLLHAEMEHVYLKIHTRLLNDVAKADEFSAEYQARFKEGKKPDAEFLSKYKLEGVKPFDMYKLARPFAGMDFTDNVSYQSALRRLLLEDIAAARRGNVDGPLKAALDVLRDVRDMIRSAVDFGGLEPRSHRDHFLGAFASASTAVSAGPPLKRLEQVVALMDAGILEIAGPEANFSCDKREGKYRVSSPRVKGTFWLCDTVIDSRVPTANLDSDTSKLTQAMRANAFIDEYKHGEGLDHYFETGGLAVTEPPFHVIDGDGDPNPDCYALGLPTEHTRWFQTIGSGTPNTISRFSRDAGAISDDIYKSVLHSVPGGDVEVEHEATRKFREARDFLLNTPDVREAHANFKWPEFDYFNWPTHWFDAVVAKNKFEALWICTPTNDKPVTFKELVTRSNQVAAWLQIIGVLEGDRVLIMLRNGVPLYELMLAAMKIGAVIIPTYTSISPTEVVDRVKRGSIQHLIAEADLAAALTGIADMKSRVSVNGMTPGWSSFAESYKAPAMYHQILAARYDDPLFGYFTSGTTSLPKLALHTQTSYPVGHLSGMYWNGCRPGDVHLNVSSPGWAKHAWSSFFVPWNAEATIVVLDYDEIKPDFILDVMRRRKVTTFCAPTTVWRMMFRHGLGPRPETLREIGSVGEPLQPQLFEAVKEAWGMEIRDGYGQSEATAMVGNAPGQKIKPGSMGLALPGYDMVVLDQVTGLPASEGEVCIDLQKRRPTGLMTGYDPNTAKTPDVASGPYYRTGDFAQIDDEGYITFIGRLDDVFKSFDYRISPFELERVLLDHPAVGEIAVVPSPDPIGLVVPKAFIILTKEYTSHDEAARVIGEHMRARLPKEHYVRRMEFVTSLPKTSSGKVQRAVLRNNEAKRGDPIVKMDGEYFFD